MKNAERNELDLLLNKGFTFEIEYLRKRKWWAVWQPKKKTVTKQIHIAEPTLATLDLLSSYWLDFAEVDTDSITTENAKHITSAYARKAAFVVSAAALGEEAFRDTNTPDWRKIEKFANMILHGVKPSILVQIAKALTACSNIADFILSIRLMSAARTTAKTNRVE